MRRAKVFGFVVVFACHVALGQPVQLIDQVDLSGGITAVGPDQNQSEKVAVSAEWVRVDGGSPTAAELRVTATIEPGWHIYSTTQPKGGPIRTEIQLADSANYRLSGAFVPTVAPDTHEEPLFDNLSVEAHEGTVVWKAPVQLTEGVDAASVRIEGSVRAQACSKELCDPPRSFRFVAALNPDEQATALAADEATVEAEPAAPVIPPADASMGTYSEANAQTTIHGELSKANANPGGSVQLTLRAVPARGYHVYALEDRDESLVSKPALIVIHETSGLSVSAIQSDKQAEEHPVEGFDGETVRYYDGAVTWTTRISIPDDAAPGEYPIAGMIGYQACTDSTCDAPRAANFAATIRVADGPSVEVTEPLAFWRQSYSKVAELAAARPVVTEPETAETLNPEGLQVEGLAATNALPLGWVLLYGFAGGLILNLMPCVLPVIGLKILSFVEQSGHDRGRILALNLWYSAGMMSVFMLLAALAAFAGFGWGQLFSLTWFNIALIAVVFTMGLSFLGVWEIPIPGFVGSGKSAELAQKEGPGGAFFKGVITTVLATPCSGPGLAVALVWSVQQPAHLKFAVFGAIGLGMASPYLLIGAFPGLIKFLPKPGAWMETFKQLMGFVLLGTVVYLLTIVSPHLVVPTVAFMFGLWAACWWIGRTPLTADMGTKLRGWAAASVVAFAAGIVSYGWLDDVMQHRLDRYLPAAGGVVAASEGEIPWQRYSAERLASLTGQNKTVLVDFTADWCPTCKWLEKFVLSTDEVRDAIEGNEVVPLIADWTHANPDIENLLDRLQQKQIPVLAIFPAGRPNRPIVLAGQYSTEQLVAKIQQAGPSIGDDAVRTASRAE